MGSCADFVSEVFLLPDRMRLLPHKLISLPDSICLLPHKPNLLPFALISLESCPPLS